MGVPSYFAWLLRKYEGQVLHSTRPESINSGVDVLYLDFNCAIHADARHHPEITVGPELYCSIYNYFLQIVAESKPKQKIFIAIDGVPPVAKIDQQRVRRYKSVKEEQIKRELAVKHNVKLDDKPDYNMISPGTQFMDELGEYFCNRLPSLRNSNDLPDDIQIVFSPSSVPGEGEHKIIEDIIQMGSDIKNMNIAVYGLDSDMIFLSLLHMSLPKEFYLLREEIEFNGGSKTHLGVFNYLDIKVLGDLMVDYLRPNETFDTSTSRDQLELFKTRTLLDYTYICLFVGNDFLPHFPSLKIRDGGLQRILESYSKLATESGGKHIVTGNLLNSEKVGYDLNNIQIDMEMLLKFVKVLSDREDSDLHDINRKIGFRTRRFKERLGEISNPYERQMEELNYVENRYCSTIQLGTNKWRQRYYQHHFKLKYRNNKEFAKSLEPICNKYFQTLNWCFIYYLHGTESKNVYNNTWFYPHDASPTLSDLYTYLNQTYQDVTLNQVRKIAPQPHWEDITPLEQLILILPPQSIQLLPEEVRKLVTSLDLAYLFPEDVKMNLANVTYWWESHPFLPSVTANNRQYIKENLDLIVELPDSSTNVKNLNKLDWDHYVL